MTIGRIPSVEGGIQPTIFDATGDLLYASAANTPARLGIGSTNQVLTVSGGVPSWATPASGGMTLISTTTMSGTTVTLSSIPTTYNSLLVVITGWYSASGNNASYFARLNASSTGHYLTYSASSTALGLGQNVDIYLTGNKQKTKDNANNAWAINIYNYASATGYKPFSVNGYFYDTGAAGLYGYSASGGYNSTTAITSISFSDGGNTISGGTIYLYGVK